jgi:hypothetical protein
VADEISAHIKVEGADAAVADLQAVAEAAQKLDGQSTSVAVSADTAAADASLEGVTGEVTALDGTTAAVGVTADAGAATESLGAVSDEVETLDGATAEVEATADASGAIDALETVSSEVEAVDGATAEAVVDVDTEDAIVALQDVGEELENIDGQSVEAEVTVDTSGASEAMEGLGEEIGAAGESGFGRFTSAATAAFAAIKSGGAGALLGIGAGITAFATKAVTDYQDLALGAGELRDALGLTAEEASRLQEVAGDLGIGVGPLEAALSRMNTTAGQSPGKFDAIGASIARSKDGTTDVLGTFLNVIDVLHRIPDATDRADAGRKVFGKGWTNLAELVDLGTQGILANMRSVESQKVTSDEQIDDAREFRDTMDELKGVLESVSLEIASSVLPMLERIAETVLLVKDRVGDLDKQIPQSAKDAGFSFSHLFDGFPDIADQFMKNRQVVRVSLGLEDLPTATSGIDSFVGTLEERLDAADTVTEASIQKQKDWVAALEASPDSAGRDAMLAGAKARLEEMNGELAKTPAVAAAAEAALQKQAEAAKQMGIDVKGATGELRDLGSTFSLMGIDQDALSDVFDIGNAPEVLAGQVRDISLAIGDLSEDLKGIKVEDVLSGDVKADKFLDAIDAIRPQIQTKVTEAFSTDGSEAATAMANSYIDQVTAELGNKFTREQVAQMLGLENIQATITAAVELSSVEKARRQLDILTGLNGETPYTASIKMALDAGTITGEQAQTLIQNQLGHEGVKVPASLEVPQTADAIAEANAALQGSPAVMPIDGDPAEALAAADAAQAYADGLIGTETYGGEWQQAQDAADAAKAYADGLVGTETVGADASTATTAADDAKSHADGLDAAIGVGADMTQFNAAMVEALKPRRVQVIGSLTFEGNRAHGGKVPPGPPGIAGEAGAEFIRLPDGTEMLLSQRTMVPAGTQVTSAARTRSIIRARRRGPARFANGTGAGSLTVNTAAAALPPIVVNLNGRPIAALIGTTTAAAVRAAAMTIRAGRA